MRHGDEGPSQREQNTSSPQGVNCNFFTRLFFDYASTTAPARLRVTEKRNPSIMDIYFHTGNVAVPAGVSFPSPDQYNSERQNQTLQNQLQLRLRREYFCKPLWSARGSNLFEDGSDRQSDVSHANTRVITEDSTDSPKLLAAQSHPIPL